MLLRVETGGIVAVVIEEEKRHVVRREKADQFRVDVNLSEAVDRLGIFDGKGHFLSGELPAGPPVVTRLSGSDCQVALGRLLSRT